MKSTTKIILFSFFMGVFIWFIDAFLDVIIFGKEILYFNSIFVPSKHEIYIRLVIIAIFLVYGFIVSGKIKQRDKIYKIFKDSENYLFTTLNSIGDAVITTDINGIIQQINPIAENFTGWEAQEAIGIHIDKVLILINENTRKPVENPVKSVINNGLLIGLANHTILVARDGTERSIADSGAPIFNNKNELIGVVFVFRDVSEERKFQKKIFESEQRFSYIINNATEGVYFLDSEGKIVIWNKGMETISGFSSEEALGNFAWDIMYECVNPDKKNVAYYNSLKESFLIALKSGEVNWLNRKNTGVMYLRNGSVKHFDQYSFLVPMQNSTGLASIINDNSEIFKSNETLRKSEEKFHKTFSMSPDTIIISRLSDGLVINANSGFLNVFGYKKNEIIGKSIFTFNFWINTEDSENLIKQLVDKKEVYHLELKLYSKSRNIIYSSVSAKLIEIENEKYIIIYSQDITQIKQLEDELRNTFLEQEKIIDSRNFELEQINEELKSKIEDREKAEKALINSEEKFRSFFNQLPVGAYRTTKDGNFLQVNKALVVILGFDTEDELLNTKAQFFYLSENERNEIIKKQADSPNIVSIENPFKRKDGKIIWVRDSAKIFRKADGSIDYMEGIIEDITFRKLAQEALSESEERYRLLFENLHDIFFCINTKGYIQNISPSVEKIIGFTAEEMIGKNIADVFENKEAKEEIIDLFNKSKQINNFVTSVKHKDGSILQISINAYFTFDKEGKFNSIDGIARDITSEINHEKFINVLYSISKSVNTAITMNELYFLLHIAMNEIIDTKNFFIADFNRITQKISFPYLTDEYIDYLEDIDLDDDSYFVTQVIKEAKPFLLKGQQITDLNAKMFSNQRICPKVWYCIPLVVHSEVIGAVGIYNYEDSDKFKKDQLELFLSIAEQIAIAIERKKSSVAVRFQNLFLQNLIDNIPNPVYYKDSVRRQFEGCNHAFEQFTGLPKEEILGKTVFDIFPLDNAAKYDRNETELIKIQGVSKYEDSLRRSDGLEQYFVFYHSCFRNNNNEVAGIVGTILNITDIKHAEEELKQNHEYSELINKVVPSCTFTVNTKRTITSWNERAAQLTGYFAEEVIGKDCILCRFHKPEQACPLFNTSVKKPVLGMEIEITTKTGEKKHIIKNMDILQNSGGEIIGGIESFEDVTGRILAEEALCWQASVNSAIADLSKAIISMADFDDVAKIILEHAKRLTDSTAGFVGYIDQSTGELIIPKEIKEIQMWEKMEGDSDFNVLWKPIINRNENLLINSVQNEAKGREIFKEDTQIYRIISAPAIYGHGVIGQIAMANSSREYTDEDLGVLERMASLLSVALQKFRAESEIRAALSKEHELSILKSHFIDLISHEYRTPLTAIGLSTELLRDFSDKLSEENKQKQYEKIQESIQSMNSLLDDIIAYSKFEVGKISSNPALIDVGLLALDLVNEISYINKDKCYIDLNVNKSPDPVEVDEKIIRQVITSILVNAIKYSHIGEKIEFNINIDKTYIEFVVRDYGIGIPEDEKHKIFTPFHRGKNIGNEPGTGLGLAIAKNSLHVIGGTITFESEENKGSTFTVNIPLPYSEEFID